MNPLQCRLKRLRLANFQSRHVVRANDVNLTLRQAQRKIKVGNKLNNGRSI